MKALLAPAEELALHVEQANPVRWHDSYFPAGGCCAVAGPELGGTQRADRQSGADRQPGPEFRIIQDLSHRLSEGLNIQVKDVLLAFPNTVL